MDSEAEEAGDVMITDVDDRRILRLDDTQEREGIIGKPTKCVRCDWKLETGV